MSSVAPVLAANEKIAKEPVKASKFISKAPAELSGKIKAESTKADAIEITKDWSGIRMKADLPKGQDKVEITLSKGAWKDIPNCNGEYFYAHHFLDDGTYDGYQKVYVNKKGDTVFTAEFSETILNGFSGIYQVTLENQDIRDLTIPMPDIDFDSIIVSGTGFVSGQVIGENDSSTYPNWQNITRLYPLNGDVLDYSGNSQHGTNNNAVLTSSYAEFNGTNYISFPTITLDAEKSAMLVEFTPHGYVTGAYSNLNGIIGSNQQFYGYLIQYSNTNIAVESSTNEQYWSAGIGTSPLYTRNNLFVKSSENVQSFYYNGVYKNMGSSPYNLTLSRLSAHANVPFNGTIHSVVMWDIGDFSNSDVIWLYTGHNGTSLQLLNNSFVAYDGNDFITSGNYHSSGLRLVTASDVPVYSDVTITGTFTEDTTLIEETETDGEIFISINHTAGSNASEGNIKYEPTISPLYEMSMNSTNPNASYVYDSGLINISTGALSTGDNYYYNFTAQLTHSTYSVSGYVLDVSDDTPISNARVYSPSLGNVYTNASGYYEYPNVLNGNYTLTAYNSEYIENSTLVEVSGTDLTNQNILLTFYTQDMPDADNWDLVSTLIWIALFIVSIGFIFQVFRNGTFSMIPFDMIIKMLWILIITAIVYILVVYLSDTI